jgi:hypothetical protein
MSDSTRERKQATCIQYNYLEKADDPRPHHSETRGARSQSPTLSL